MSWVRTAFSLLFINLRYNTTNLKAFQIEKFINNSKIIYSSALQKNRYFLNRIIVEIIYKPYKFYSMKIKVNFFLCIMAIFVISSCERKFGDFFDPPQDLESDLYAQLSNDPELSVFLSAIDLVPGLKEELSSSGLNTIMVPSNAAFAKYFSGHPIYKSVNDIPLDELDALVKFHIMKWMYFSYQFLKTDIFKFETRSSVPYIAQPLIGNSKELYSPAKLFMVFTPDYITMNGITNSDYSYVFGPDAKFNTQTNINIMGASVVTADISAGNGACYIIDEVLVPPLNIAREIDSNNEYEVYNRLIQRNFVEYSYNGTATMARCPNGDCSGDGMVDSLWNRNYSFLRYTPFLDQENPQTINMGVITYHMYTAYLPEKQAFNNYLNNKLIPAFGSENEIPVNTLALLFQSHLSNDMDWPSKIDRGRVVNSLGDILKVSTSDIVNVKIASNGLVYRLNKVIEPKAFTHVTGPAFFSPDYSYFAEMLIMTNSLISLVSDDMEFTIFAPTNDAFIEQNVLYLTDPPAGNAPGFYRYDTNNLLQPIGYADITNIMGNHILPGKAYSSSSLEDGFHLAQNGRYIVFDDGRFFASERDSVYQFIDGQKDQRMENGYFHGIDKMLIPPTYSLYEQINRATSPFSDQELINVQYYKFKELCEAANILRSDFMGLENVPPSITGVSTGRRFTLFVPSNQAIINAQNAGLLPKTGLENPDNETITEEERLQLAYYLSYFFINVQQIFTDGKTTGTFETRYPNFLETKPNKNVFLNATVSYDGGQLTLTGSEGDVGKVVMSDPVNMPQNMICRDGIIQIVDNVFINQYKEIE